MPPWIRSSSPTPRLSGTSSPRPSRLLSANPRARPAKLINNARPLQAEAPVNLATVPYSGDVTTRAGSNRRPSASQAAYAPSLHVAACGPMGRLAAKTMARCRLMWPEVCRRWLPSLVASLLPIAFAIRHPSSTPTVCPEPLDPPVPLRTTWRGAHKDSAAALDHRIGVFQRQPHNQPAMLRSPPLSSGVIFLTGAVRLPDIAVGRPCRAWVLRIQHVVEGPEAQPEHCHHDHGRCDHGQRRLAHSTDHQPGTEQRNGAERGDVEPGGLHCDAA